MSQSVPVSNQFRLNSIDPVEYTNWGEKYQAQLVFLSAQISWSKLVESDLKKLEANTELENSDQHPLVLALSNVENTLKILADSVLQDQAALGCRKLEHLIIEHVHRRDVLRDLLGKNVNNSKSVTDCHR
ncbi:dynein heavy cytoplasmic isoform X1 [Brachionus plicatilis]|uniref:Dynein heavy cytoplasmic isoform X1 n=1 Tax=Brachionus plicatilis TaxID=10195 RepID=A0A3M7RLC7_BRAPC|nr:dynein heavy cytoplasmic isoform X1 [Brachionus plicatilis]